MTVANPSRVARSPSLARQARESALDILGISGHLPIKLEFIETREKVDAILPELEKRTGSGLIEVQETTIVVSPSFIVQ